jgi:hypothetical protein
MLFAPAYAAVNATGRFRIRSVPDAVTLAAPTLTRQELLLSVTAAPGATGDDQTVPASLRKYNWFVAFV